MGDHGTFVKEDGEHGGTPLQLDKVSYSNFAALLYVPRSEDYDKTTHLVNGAVQVSASNKEFTYAVNGRVLMQAKKTSPATYSIASVPQEGAVQDGQMHGQTTSIVLSKAWTKCSHSIGYKLSVVNNDIACIVYTVPSLSKKISDNPARQATMALHFTYNALFQLKSSIVSDCYEVCSSQGAAQLAETGVASSNVTVLTSKDSKKAGGGLYFSGRGKLASSKNMQLVDEKKRVVWQMSKIDRHEYHVDFRSPINTVQSFALAIAQCDL